MKFLLILFACVVVVGCGISFYMYIQDKRAHRKSSGGHRRSSHRVPSYSLSSWIDNEIASRKLYRKPDITAGELADELGISARSLRRAINNAYEKTVSEYLDDRRIQAACRLLREQPDMPMEEIAGKSGFASVETFKEVFRCIMGQTPDHYRNQMTAKNRWNL